MSNVFEKAFNANTPTEEATPEVAEVIETQEPEAQEVEIAEEPEAPVVTEEPEAEASKPEAEDVADVDYDEETDTVVVDKKVPVGVLKAISDKKKASDAEARKYREEADQLRREIESLKAPIERNMPDPYDDPQGFYEALRREAAEERFVDRVALSESIARRNHASAVVDAAFKWSEQEAARNGSFAQTLRQQPDPVEWVIQQQKAATQFENFKTDPDAYVRQRAAELGLLNQQTAVANVAVEPQPTTERIVPKSITNVPAANSTNVTVTHSKEEVFKRAFNP